MEIIESWQDHHNNIYIIARHTPKDQEAFRTKEYEALYLLGCELNSFGGSVGYRTADFFTIEEARDFLLKGISGWDVDPDGWLERVET